MAQTFSRAFLTGMPFGEGLGLTSAGATSIHATPSGYIDEVWLYVVNNDTTSHQLTIYWGATAPGGSSGSNEIRQTVSGRAGLYLVVPGLTIANGRYVNGTSDSSTAFLVVSGFVNRIAIS